MKAGHYTASLMAQITGGLIGVHYCLSVMEHSPTLYAQEICQLQQSIRRHVVALAVLSRRPSTPRALIVVARNSARRPTHTLQRRPFKVHPRQGEEVQHG